MVIAPAPTPLDRGGSRPPVPRRFFDHAPRERFQDSFSVLAWPAQAQEGLASTHIACKHPHQTAVFRDGLA
jgi:hypothetical protein